MEKFSVDAGFVASEDNLVAHLAENIERDRLGSRNAYDMTQNAKIQDYPF
jgi:hypothetical protein